MSKVLFVLRRKEDYNDKTDYSIGLSTGLYNSASFVNNMLNDNGIDSNIEVVLDNNCIDRVITLHKPDYCIIEALWVTPSKMTELSKLHPTVKWIIRLHSEMAFISGEGIFSSWLSEYARIRNVIIAVNSPRLYNDILSYLKNLTCWVTDGHYKKLIQLGNYYPQDYVTKVSNKDSDTINIGCFGAIRLLKNQLIQAFAAIEFADSIDKKLNFHINGSRIEMNSNATLSNLKGLFEQVYDKGHRLICHEWTPRDEFLGLCANMDIAMQVSLSETFNIVACDCISQGIPIVGCSEIPWQLAGKANPTDSRSIVRKIHSAYKHPQWNVFMNHIGLEVYTDKIEKQWITYFK